MMQMNFYRRDLKDTGEILKLLGDLKVTDIS